jgi:hypothetical protein
MERRAPMATAPPCKRPAKNELVAQLPVLLEVLELARGRLLLQQVGGGDHVRFFRDQRVDADDAAAIERRAVQRHDFDATAFDDLERRDGRARRGRDAGQPGQDRRALGRQRARLRALQLEVDERPGIGKRQHHAVAAGHRHRLRRAQGLRPFPNCNWPACAGSAGCARPCSRPEPYRQIGIEPQTCCLRKRMSDRLPILPQELVMLLRLH